MVVEGPGAAHVEARFIEEVAAKCVRVGHHDILKSELILEGKTGDVHRRRKCERLRDVACLAEVARGESVLAGNHMVAAQQELVRVGYIVGSGNQRVRPGIGQRNQRQNVARNWIDSRRRDQVVGEGRIRRRVARLGGSLRKVALTFASGQYNCTCYGTLLLAQAFVAAE